jgi:hypothetical protein
MGVFDGFGEFVDQAGSVADTRDNTDPDRRLDGSQRATAYTRLFVRHTFGGDVENLAFESPGDEFAGQEDRSSILGPSVWGSGSLADVVIDTDGEDHSERESRSRWWLLGLAGLLVAYVVGQLFTVELGS